MTGIPNCDAFWFFPLVDVTSLLIMNDVDLLTEPVTLPPSLSIYAFNSLRFLN